MTKSNRYLGIKVVAINYIDALQTIYKFLKDTFINAEIVEIINLSNANLQLKRDIERIYNAIGGFSHYKYVLESELLEVQNKEYNIFQFIIDLKPKKHKIRISDVAIQVRK